MPWIYAVVGLLVGIVLGVIISRLTTPQYKQQKNIKKELEESKFTLEQQRQELADHFAQTAEMLDVLGKDYTKLYQHMAKTSSELLPNQPEQDNPFVKKITQQSNDDEQTSKVNEQPKDYANGATGLLTEPAQEIIDAPEVVSAKA